MPSKQFLKNASADKFGNLQLCFTAHLEQQFHFKNNCTVDRLSH